MNGHDPARVSRGSDPSSPLAGLVCSLIGRRIRDLRIEVRGAGLVLHGRANSYHAKQLAQHAVMTVTDLPLIANEIEVVDPLAGTRDEQEPFAPPRRLVLLATGDDRLRSFARHHLAEHGYAVATAAGGVECVALARELAADLDVVVLDADLLWGGADGVLAQFRARGIRVPVVLLAPPSASLPECREAPAAPVVSVVAKPDLRGNLVRAVRDAAGVAFSTNPEP